MRKPAGTSRSTFHAQAHLDRRAASCAAEKRRTGEKCGTESRLGRLCRTGKDESSPKLRARSAIVIDPPRISALSIPPTCRPPNRALARSRPRRSWPSGARPLFAERRTVRSRPPRVGHSAENPAPIDSTFEAHSTDDIVETVVKMSSSKPTDFFAAKFFVKSSCIEPRKCAACRSFFPTVVSRGANTKRGECPISHAHRSPKARDAAREHLSRRAAAS